MPTNLKFQTIFEGQEGYGWTEIHYAQSSSDTPDLGVQLANYATNVCLPRAQMLGNEAAIVGYRVSYPRAGAIASYALRQKITGVITRPSSDPASSLAVNFVDSTSTRRKICHLRGWWDDICYDESFHPESAAGAEWTSAFIAWKNALTAKPYGWLTKDAAASKSSAMVTYTVSNDGHVTFVLPAPGIPDPLGSRVLDVRFSGFNNRASILNRQILCNWVDATHLTSVRTIGAGPMQTTGKFNYRAVTFVGYAQTGSISLGERRMGRPLNRYPGRRRAMPLS